MEWTRALPRIDHNSEQGKACQNAVKIKLKDYLGQEYADDVLPLYIVVMLAHGNSASLVAENLEAFLGKNDAVSFTTWLIEHLDKHGDEYAAKDAAGGGEIAVVEAADKQDRHRHVASKVVAEPAKEQRKEQGREKIEWRGEDGREARRTPDREKRPRESPGRAERRHTSRHDREAEEGRDEKRRRQDMRELRPLDASRDERRRSRHRDDGAHYREDRERDLEKQRRAAERHRMEREMELDREFERRRELDYRERLHREREWDREPDRGDHMHDRGDRGQGDRPWDRERPPRYAREPLGLQMDRDDHEKAEMDWREERARRLAEPRRQNGALDRDLDPHHVDVHLDRRSPQALPPQSVVNAAGPHQRSTVFDRLATDVRNREESARSLAAARKSVFDRLRGNRQANAASSVQPDALTDEELDEMTPPRGLPSIRTAPGQCAQAAPGQLQSAAKAEELLEMQRKMLELQQQVKQLEREQRTPRATPTPVVVHTSGGPLQTQPSVDPCSVHVQNLSLLAIPDIIGAHFSGCGRVMNVTVARDLQGKPKGFAHVEFSNELEAQNALSLSGSILLNQVITVMPKMNMPPKHYVLPGYGASARGRGRGRASFGSPGRGAFRGGFPRPFSGRAPHPARGRGRAAPLGSNKYVRPELKAGAGAKSIGSAAATKLPTPEKAPQAANGVAAPAAVKEAPAAPAAKQAAAGP